MKSANLPHYYTDYHSLVKDDGKWKIVAKLWATATDPYEDAFAGLQEQEAEIAQIYQALRFYFEGLYEGDGEKILIPFAPGAEMFFTNENGKLAAVPASSLREILRNSVSPQEKGEPRHEFIQHIEMSGPSTALVKLNCAFSPAFYTDYLFMAKEEDVWKMVAKTTMTNP